MAKVHPTALVDASARLADDVEIGPYCVVEADVEIGSGTVVRSHAIVRRYTTLGRDNVVDSFVVLGGVPQDRKFDADSATYLVIGDDNTFREGVTISRATGQGKCTVVGNETYWMAYAHAGHNSIVKDGTILTNSVALAGHAEVGPRAVMSGHSGVHQFCWVGKLAMIQGHAIVTMHIPPYVIAAEVNRVVALNSVGLRRAEDISAEDREQIKEAFRLTYRSGLTPKHALAKMDTCTDWGEAASLFRDFVRRVLTAEAPYKRGMAPSRRQR